VDSRADSVWLHAPWLRVSAWCSSLHSFAPEPAGAPAAVGKGAVAGFLRARYQTKPCAVCWG